MNYLKNVQKVATISFSEIGFKTPTKVAKGMQKEIIAFFQENPDGGVKLEFGGYARLSQGFAVALLGGGVLDQYMGKISTHQIHIFDQQIIKEALSM